MSTLTKRAIENYDEQVASLVPADMAYAAVATIMILLITPGIGLFYGGMLRGKNFTTMLLQSFLNTGIITVQFFLFGFSLACSNTSSSVIIGNFTYGALQNISVGPLSEGGTVPAIITFTFNAIFAVCTVQIFTGAIAERGRLLPSLVLGFLWCTLCYCPFAYWTWSTNGWLYKLGSLDFAGGGPVHISSGTASLVYSFFLGKRKGWIDGKPPKYKPYSPILSFIGAVMIYIPWLFFNSGTLTTVTTPKTLYILTNTQLAVGFAMGTYTFMDYAINKKWSLLAASEGTIVGLVLITPTCAELAPWAVAVGSIVTAIVCRSLYDLNIWLQIDDTTHSFVIHAIGGFMGSIFNGLFASPNIAATDGVTESEGGWIFHHWKQMGYQLAGSVAIIVWTALMTYALCFIINLIPGLKMRVSEEAEEMGLDCYEMREWSDPSITSDISDVSHVEYFNGQQGASSNSNLSSNNIELGDVKRPIEQV
ncbi:Ammonium transporter 1 member 2 2 [Wickerhamomyces ciferrii]|uniref:Ammonium transporter n=1 Tax=Wickerhamomyces ciferrii (strain ATCC 14091 / BCRC 22168 / CBS 111 / JCM 3599 / NBRC 0793 / NRRL Y-1031 F-60-10) TaxID=1206466 RepID=K0KKE5_WICCF|nr:Ammonium transporter 1 member 2 2 [Wickerhamomyces ciferrii]CCH45690.1 Ammonium transporter 1 member 2 2 [Wickerhamomyces ciferrii]